MEMVHLVMPTKKPRVAVTLDPYLHETISRLACLQGRTRGAVINDLLMGVHPPLLRTVALLEAAKDAPKQVVDGLKGTLEAMEREMTGVAGTSMADMEWLTGEFQHRSDLARQAHDSTPDRKAERQRSAGGVRCTCTYTPTERLGDAACPHHGRRRGPTPV